MTIGGLKLGHINIRAASLEDTVAFYERVIGLRRGRSDTNPDIAQNLWLFDADGAPCVHVNQRKPDEVRAPDGGIDHLAFDCADRAGMEAHLTALAVPYTAIQYPAARMVQLILRDPNGVKVELTCREPVRAA